MTHPAPTARIPPKWVKFKSALTDGGRPIASVARSLEMSSKSLANWVYHARRGEAIVKRTLAQPVTEWQAEVSRLRQENAKLKLEREILKHLAPISPVTYCLLSSAQKKPSGDCFRALLSVVR